MATVKVFHRFLLSKRPPQHLKYTPSVGARPRHSQNSLMEQGIAAPDGLMNRRLNPLAD
jgi:hypothetical protein